MSKATLLLLLSLATAYGQTFATSEIKIGSLQYAYTTLDARARDEMMDHAARHALRQQEAPPLLDKIKTQILAMSKNVLPKSAAGEACAYTIKLWDRALPPIPGTGT
jgi:hypothetical protein